MADFTSLNGYDVKDKSARNSIKEINEKIIVLNSDINDLKNTEGIILDCENNDDITDLIKTYYTLAESDKGVIIYIPSGTYTIRPLRVGIFDENEVNIHNLDQLDGSKYLKVVGLGDVTIKLPDNSNSDMLMFAECTHGIEFENITFDGNRDNQTIDTNSRCYWAEHQTLLLMFRCENVKIKNCNFINSQFFGVNASKDCVNVEVINCEFDNCNTGIDFIVHKGVIDGVKIDDCNVGIILESWQTEVGVEVGRNDNIIIKNSIINAITSIQTGCCVYNLKIENVEGIICYLDSSTTSTQGLDRVYICKSKFRNVYLGYATNVFIEDNVIDVSNLPSNIVLEGVFNNQALLLSGLKNVYVKNNVIISDSTRGAITVNGGSASRYYIQNNLITTTSGGAITIQNGSIIDISNNNIVTDGNHCVVIRYGLKIYVVNNVFECAKRGIGFWDATAKESSTYHIGQNIGETLTASNIQPSLKVDVVGTLPTANAELVGNIIVYNGMLHICKYSNGDYSWVQV